MRVKITSQCHCFFNNNVQYFPDDIINLDDKEAKLQESLGNIIILKDENKDKVESLHILIEQDKPIKESKRK